MKEQAFVRPTQQGKTKSHSPTNGTYWDVSSAMAMLQNWSAEAQKLGITGANRGQILKETAQRHGIDTMALDG